MTTTCPAHHVDDDDDESLKITVWPATGSIDKNLTAAVIGSCFGWEACTDDPTGG